MKKLRLKYIKVPKVISKQKVEIVKAKILDYKNKSPFETLFVMSLEPIEQAKKKEIKHIEFSCKKNIKITPSF